MGVYIKGMDVPDINDYNGISCCLYKTLGGQLRLRNNETGQFFDVDTVPPHGRCIDADEFFKALTMDDRVSILEAMHVQSILSDAPTIIPAEEGEG